jgi:RNA polymerase sigma factor (sigma-70 family)
MHQLLSALDKPPTAPGALPTDRRARRSSVADLVAAAATGDQRAWEALVTRFDPMLRGVARRFRLPSHQVDDAVQDTWTRLVRHLHRLENPAAVGAWLATTTRHESLRVLRTTTLRELPTDNLIAVDERQADAHVDLDTPGDHEWRASLRSALGALPPRHRALLEMLHQEPARSYEDTAAALGMPVGSIGPTRARALERLRRHPRLAALHAARTA